MLISARCAAWLLASTLVTACFAFPGPILAAELSGRVFGYPDGDPLDGVEILVMDRLGQASAASTGDDGAYRAVDIDPGLHRVRARPPQQSNRIGAYYDDRYFFCSADLVRLDADSVVTGVDLMLPAGGFIVGEIRDVQGSVSGATVTASGLDWFNASLQRTASTDDLGRFRISGLDSIILGDELLPGNYRLSVQRAGQASLYFPGTWDVESAVVVPAFREQESVASLQYPLPASVVGRVLDSDGEAVAHAQVSLHLVGGGGVRNTQADAGGQFSFDDIYSGLVTLSAEASGLVRSWFPGAAVESEGEQLLLSAGEERDVEIVLSEEALLRVAITAPGQPAGRLLVFDVATGSLLMGESLGADPLQELLLSGLPGRTVNLRVEPAADSLLALFESGPVELAAGETTAASVSLRVGVQIVASVRRRGGAALRGAQLSAVDADDSGRIIGSARSDGDGHLVLRGLPPGAQVRLRFALQTFCSGDPTSVERWWPDARSDADASPIHLEASAVLDLGEMLLPPDADADQMDDVWELAWGLDPLLADGGEDPDGDGLSNLEEYRGYSDPLDPPSQQSGCHFAATRSIPSLAALCLLLGRICRIRMRTRREYDLSWQGVLRARRRMDDTLFVFRATSEHRSTE